MTEKLEIELTDEMYENVGDMARGLRVFSYEEMASLLVEQGFKESIKHSIPVCFKMLKEKYNFSPRLTVSYSAQSDIFPTDLWLVKLDYGVGKTIVVGKPDYDAAIKEVFDQVM